MRILQITDSHVQLREQPHAGAMAEGPVTANTTLCPTTGLEACLRAASSFGVDLVVLTGDNVHEEDEQSYTMLLQHLRHGLPPHLASSALLIPGNHDRRKAQTKVFHPVVSAGLPEPGPDMAVFATIMPSGWLLIGLDTLQDGTGHGVMGNDQLRWLEKILGMDRPAELPLPPLLAASAEWPPPTLLFTHHPPLPLGAVGTSPGFTAQAGQMFDEADRLALEALLRRSPQVHAVFCGHVHAEFEYKIAERIPVIGTPSSWIQHSITAQEPADRVAYEDLPPGMRLISCDGDTATTATVSSKVIRVDDAGSIQRNIARL